MESREDIERVNRVLAEMGEPPLQETDVVREQLHEVAAGQGADEATTDGEERQIVMVEPDGHRRANLVFLNGRYLLIDMQEDELLAEVNGFLDDPNPAHRYLTLPLIDTIDEGKKTEVVVAAPIHLTRKALEMMQSIGRSWPKKVPGQKRTDNKIVVARGGEAEQVLAQLPLNRQQRRRLQYVRGEGG